MTIVDLHYDETASMHGPNSEYVVCIRDGRHECITRQNPLHNFFCVFFKKFHNLNEN